MGKPNTLPFAGFAFDQAAALQADPEFGTDQVLQPLIKLQRIIEDARNVYLSSKSPSARSRLYLHAERLSADLEQWKSSLPQGFDVHSKMSHHISIL